MAACTFALNASCEALCACASHAGSQYNCLELACIEKTLMSVLTTVSADRNM